MNLSKMEGFLPGKRPWPNSWIKQIGLALRHGRQEIILRDRVIIRFQALAGTRQRPMQNFPEKACLQDITGVWPEVNILLWSCGTNLEVMLFLLLSVIFRAKALFRWGVFQALPLTAPMIWRGMWESGALTKPRKGDWLGAAPGPITLTCSRKWVKLLPLTVLRKTDSGVLCILILRESPNLRLVC